MSINNVFLTLILTQKYKLQALHTNLLSIRPLDVLDKQVALFGITSTSD